MSRRPSATTLTPKTTSRGPRDLGAQAHLHAAERSRHWRPRFPDVCCREADLRPRETTCAIGWTEGDVDGDADDRGGDRPDEPDAEDDQDPVDEPAQRGLDVTNRGPAHDDQEVPVDRCGEGLKVSGFSTVGGFSTVVSMNEPMRTMARTAGTIARKNRWSTFVATGRPYVGEHEKCREIATKGGSTGEPGTHGPLASLAAANQGTVDRTAAAWPDLAAREESVRCPR